MAEKTMSNAKQKVSNYEKWSEEWRERFLSLDQNRLVKTLPGLHTEGDYLTLFHFNKKYGIHRGTGEICLLAQDSCQPVKPSADLSTSVRLNIYTLLWYARPSAHFTGDWVTFDKLKGTRPFAPAFQRGVTDTFAKTFTGHMDRLILACEAMGGRKLSYADVGYELPAFECIPVRYLFWEGDDEFPAQANILFDSSATDFIHGESIVTIATVGLYELAELADVAVNRETFPMM